MKIVHPNDRFQTDATAEIAEVHGEDIALLRELVDQANRDLIVLDQQTFESSAIYFQILVLSQTINAAWKAIDLICQGYPRLALYFARLLREGHIATRWAWYHPDVASKLLRNRADHLVGEWPSTGKMAQDVIEGLKASGQSREVIDEYDTLLLLLGDTQDQLYSHAVSNFALHAAQIEVGRSFSPAIGPVYEIEQTSRAIEFLMPHCRFLLVDASDLQKDVLKRKRSPEATRLLADSHEWIDRHPTGIWPRPSRRENTETTQAPPEVHEADIT